MASAILMIEDMNAPLEFFSSKYAKLRGLQIFIRDATNFWQIPLSDISDFSAHVCTNVIILIFMFLDDSSNRYELMKIFCFA
jgi:hypothetical protein